MTIYDGQGNAISDSTEASPGGVIFLDDDGQPDVVPMAVKLVSPSEVHGNFALDYSSDHIQVYRDAGCTEPIDSGDPVITPTSCTMVYVAGLTVSDSVGDSPISLHYVGDSSTGYAGSGGTTPALDTVAVTSVKTSLLRDGFDITNEPHVQVLVGEWIDLSVKLTPTLDMPLSYSWSIPGNAVKSYAVTETTGHVIRLSDADYTTSSPSFVWADGGLGLEVAIAVTGFGGNNGRAIAKFDVDRPETGFTATTYEGGNHGIMVFDCPDEDKTLQLGSLKECSDGTFTGQPGITFTAYSSSDQWMYMWVQIVTSYGRRQGPEGNDTVPENVGLDAVVPYGIGYTATDSPSLVARPGDYVSYDFNATMWLMCKPGNGGCWVPLANLEWSWFIRADYDNNPPPSGPEGLVIENAGHFPPGGSTSVNQTEYPEWDRLVTTQWVPE